MRWPSCSDSIWFAAKYRAHVQDLAALDLHFNSRPRQRYTRREGEAVLAALIAAGCGSGVTVAHIQAWHSSARAPAAAAANAQRGSSPASSQPRASATAADSSGRRKCGGGGRVAKVGVGGETGEKGQAWYIREPRALIVVTKAGRELMHRQGLGVKLTASALLQYMRSSTDREFAAIVSAMRLTKNILRLVTSNMYLMSWCSTW